MARSLRGLLDTQPKKSDTKVVEKYATLPRRKKDREDKDAPSTKPKIREDSINRLAQPKKPAVTAKRRQKVRIYHETGAQTALTGSDINKALSGVAFTPSSPSDVEKCDRGEQVDAGVDVEAQLSELRTAHEQLQREYGAQTLRLREVTMERECLAEELRVNSERVMALLGEGCAAVDDPGDSLLVLESRFHNVGQIVVRQEEEISRLNALCRGLQLEAERAQQAQRALVAQHREAESEHAELQEFVQAEKSAVAEALRETEAEMRQLREALARKNTEAEQLAAVNEQHWQENLALRVKLGALEARSRELLVHQGSAVSGAAVALAALVDRLEGLVGELVTSYRISEQELDVSGVELVKSV